MILYDIEYNEKKTKIINMEKLLGNWLIVKKENVLQKKEEVREITGKKIQAWVKLIKRKKKGL